MQQAPALLLRTVIAELGPRDPRDVVEPARVPSLPRGEAMVVGVEHALVGDAVEGEELAVVVLLTLLLALQGALHSPVVRHCHVRPKLKEPGLYSARAQDGP